MIIVLSLQDGITHRNADDKNSIQFMWTAPASGTGTIRFGYVPYSGKFSWVQIFADMPSDPSEEIFVVFIFVGYACSSDHTPIITRTYVHYVAIRDVRSLVKIFVVFIFAVTCRSAKHAKICTPRKFPAIR